MLPICLAWEFARYGRIWWHCYRAIQGLKKPSCSQYSWGGVGLGTEMGVCFLFDFSLKGEPLNKAGKKNSQQHSVRNSISVRVKKLVEKMFSFLKFGLKKIEKGRVSFSMFIQLSSALLKRIPRLFLLTTLRFTSRSGLWASKLDSFQIKFNWKMCSRSTANVLQTVSNVQTMGTDWS